MISTWKEDGLLRQVVKNSGYLFSSSTLSIPLGAIQSILAARLLGVTSIGVLGIVITLVTNFNRFFSFRMGEPVVKYMGEYMARGEKVRAAAVVKAAALTEVGTSVAAYLLLVLLAPLAARIFTQDPANAPLIYLYGLMLIANLIPETSTAVLQVGGHYRSQAALNLFSSAVTAALIVWAFIVRGNIWFIISAYLIGKVIYGVGMTGYAFFQAHRMLGANWLQAPLKNLPERRGFWKFALSTNMSGTVTLLARDSEELWLGLFLNPTAAGYYKMAKAVVSLLLTPITPLINTTYPEIAKASAQRIMGRLRDLLKKLTFLSGLWTVSTALILAIFGSWLIPFVYGPEFGPSYPAALLLLVGYGIANIFFWNRSLLLSLNLPNFSLIVTAIAAAIKIGLSFLLVPRYGYLMEASLLSVFFVLTVGFSVVRGVKEILQP